MSRLPVAKAGIAALHKRFHDGPGFPRSAWFYDANFECYLRVGKRLIAKDSERQWGVYVTISNMTAARWRTGLMRELFELCEAYAAENELDGTYVESVVNTLIVPFVLARGYQHITSSDPLGLGLGDYWRCATSG